MTDFYGKVQDENRETPYPLKALHRALLTPGPADDGTTVTAAQVRDVR
jgi:hypothetical protein